MNGSPVVGHPLRLSRQAAFWLFWMLVGGCLLFVGVEQIGYFGSYPGAWLLSVVLLAATAIPAGIIIYRFDQFEPEPASLVAVAVVWGGVVAVTFAGLANELMFSFLQHVVPAVTVDSWAASLTAPINEELYKGAGLVIMYLMARREFDGVMDGLVYGAMIGLGFQVMENVQYFMLAANGSDGDAGSVVSMFFLRVVLSGLYSHMLFTAFAGFGFAYFVTRREQTLSRRLGLLILCMALAWAAHFVWNSPWLESLMAKGTGGFAGEIVIKGMPFVILLALLAVFARRREGQAFAQLMRSEVGSDTVTEEEFQTLKSRRQRRKALRRMKRTKGATARTVLKRLMREQINLALFHGKVASPDHPALETQREIIRTLKARLASIG
jgi:RsiW-degrading membrane proteinase PrsW (M82 family)